MKVTVVGAGNVGATCADVLSEKEVCNEVILVDIKEGLSWRKASKNKKRLLSWRFYRISYKWRGLDYRELL